MPIGWMKKASYLAAILIVVGVLGAAAFKFNFNSDKHLVETSRKWTYAIGELTALDLGSGSNNMKVQFVDSGSSAEGYVEITGEVDQDTARAIEQGAIADHTLILDLRSKQWRIFDFDFGDKPIQVTVGLPHADQLLIDSVKLHGSSGNLEVVDAKAKQLQFSATSGNLKMNGLSADEIAMKVVSGNIIGSGIDAKTITASTSSGNISIGEAAGTITAKASSGNIKIQQKTAGSADLQTSSGNISFTVAPDFAGFYDLRSSSGSVKSPDSKLQTKDVIKARASSGNVRIYEP